MAVQGLTQDEGVQGTHAHQMRRADPEALREGGREDLGHAAPRAHLENSFSLGRA